MPSHPAHPPVWRPVSWAGLGDPPRVLPSVPTEEGGEPSKLETHWCGGKRRGRSRAATARKRPQGRSGAQMGAPWRQSEEQPQCKAISAGGPSALRPPVPRTAREELSGAHAHSPGGPGPRSIRRRQARLAQGRHCLCTGVSWAIMLSDLPVPAGMGFASLPPHTLRAREAVPRAIYGGPPGGARRPRAGKDDGADSSLSTNRGSPHPHRGPHNRGRFPSVSHQLA